MLLLRTVHGSRLYGLAHSGSDHDLFEVTGWAKGRTRQHISGGIDTTRTSYDSFMWCCDRGVPQFLEAMFSQCADVDNMPFSRAGYGVNHVNVRDTYMRTIKSFWLGGDFKKKRHAARLALNLADISRSGRFNPTLNIQQIRWVNSVAELSTMPEELAWGTR